MISSSPRKCQENTKTKPQNGNAAKFKSHRNCGVAGSDFFEGCYNNRVLLSLLIRLNIFVIV